MSPGTEPDVGAGADRPATLRRAVAFIEAHAHEPVTLADISDAARTSPRAVQYAFRRGLATTPTGYLRGVRLERAHHDLQVGDPTRGDTVAAIAARWGFAKAGRFSATYASAYGRPPRQTLRQ